MLQFHELQGMWDKKKEDTSEKAYCEGSRTKSSNFISWNLENQRPHYLPNMCYFLWIFRKFDLPFFPEVIRMLWI